MRFSYAGSINAAILDIMLFGGFATYINIMNESVEFVEILIRNKIMEPGESRTSKNGNQVVEVPVSSVVHPLNGTFTLCHRISERVPVKTISNLISSAYEYHDSHEDDKCHQNKNVDDDGPISFEELEPLLQKANPTMFGYSTRPKPIGVVKKKEAADVKEVDISAKSGKKKKRRNKKSKNNNKNKEDTTNDQNKTANVNCHYLCAFKAAELSFEKGIWENGTYYPFQEQNLTFCSV